MEGVCIKADETPKLAYVNRHCAWCNGRRLDQAGKKKAAARHRQKKWRLGHEDWEMLAKLCAVLEVFYI